MYKKNVLIHHGILGQKWGVRRYQNKDGTLTEAGKKHYLDGKELERASKELVSKTDTSNLDKHSKTIKNLSNELIKDNDDYYKSLKNNEEFKKNVME